ncbi:1135_t:CDS:1 [Ambispora gerdemannii]|uniref:1135_t:CDS:1 n=1 Tax=Ambispora gerdemannii TaxID=144530 RepID=A0A9N9F500_9GLOM|nr:1135_t:CDS:1 [Ambispora gerdemannii]
MVNAQIWLDQKHPPETREVVTELNISSEELKGSLNLYFFNNLRKLNCSGNVITSLDLNDCTQLEELTCSYNKIAKIDMSNCTQISRLDCSNNCLVNFDFSKLDPEKLIELFVDDNNFPKQGLSCFSRFKNLEKLSIGNSKKIIAEHNTCNQFTGSLRALEKLGRLEELDINNTDIDRGLEYLSDNLKRIKYLKKNERSIELNSNQLLLPLQPYHRPLPYNHYDMMAWRKDHFRYYTPFLVLQEGDKIQKQKISSLEEELKQKKEENIILWHQLEDLENLRNTCSGYTKFIDNYFQSKKFRLSEMTISAKSKLDDETQDMLDTLLETQEEIIQDSGSKFTSKRLERLERTKRALSKKLNSEEIQILLAEQEEVAKLNDQLELLQIRETKLQSSSPNLFEQQQ